MNGRDINALMISHQNYQNRRFVPIYGARASTIRRQTLKLERMQHWAATDHLIYAFIALNLMGQLHLFCCF